MPDQTQTLTPHLLSHHIPGLDLGRDLVHPMYSGHSILNLPPTICRWLGVPEIGGSCLEAEISDVFGPDIRRVILVLVDGLGLERMQRWLLEDNNSPWHALIQDGLLAPLTSITPSTSWG